MREAKEAINGNEAGIIKIRAEIHSQLQVREKRMYSLGSRQRVAQSTFSMHTRRNGTESHNRLNTLQPRCLEA